LKAEIISVGTELLLGQITDTNATYICRRLASIGIDVHFRSTVGDNWDRMTSVLRGALERADVVITTGGLGPTSDDITREVIAQLTGRPLELDSSAERHLREIFTIYHPEMPLSNLKQAMVPRGARLLPNDRGTAPGLLIEHDGQVIIALPGPPHEMQAMLDGSVLPYLQKRSGKGSLITKSRVLRLCGIGESSATERIRDLLDAQTDPTIAPLASPGEVHLRITTKASDEAQADRKIAQAEAEIRKRLGRHIFGVDDQTLESVVGDLLRTQGKTLAVAESCTGGLIGSRITDVPGSSDYFLAALVTYSNTAKIQLLGVNADTLQAKGAVSEEVACQMAAGVRQRIGADVSIATTGIAGPTGGTPDKPVGLVYIGIADDDGVSCQRFEAFGNRTQIKYRASQAALDWLRRKLMADGEW